MPTYTYKCLQCGDTSNISHPMLEDEIFYRCNVCPDSPFLNKVPNFGSVAFKGGGWGKDAR